MPLLFVLGGYGSVRILRPGAARGFATLRVPLLGAASILGGMLLVGYIAPRYLVEFLPALTIASTAGLFALTMSAPRWSRWKQRAALATAIVLAALGVGANLAVAAVTARTLTGGETLRDLVSAQAAVAELVGGSDSRVLVAENRLPDRSGADQIGIVGDCDSMFYGTGDLYEPWVRFEQRDLRVDVTLRGPVRAGQVELIRFDGYVQRAVYMQFDRWGFYRLRLWHELRGYTDSFWYEADPGMRIPVTVTIAPDGRFDVDSSPHLHWQVATADFRPDLVRQPVVARAAALGAARLRRYAIAVESSRDPVSGLCRGLVSGQ
jgi:hypothetical protein